MPAPASAYRDFPGRRWLGVLLRAAHLAGVVGVGAQWQDKMNCCYPPE